MSFSNSTKSSHSKRHRSSLGGFNSEINITPFVDVMLVLLIIFMVSAPLLVNGVPLDLPKVQSSNLEPDTKPITLSLDGKGGFYLENRPFSTAQQLVNELNIKINSQEKSQQQIFIRGSKQASYQSILEFLALLQNNNFTKISLLSLAQ